MDTVIVSKHRLKVNAESSPGACFQAKNGGNFFENIRENVGFGAGFSIKRIFLTKIKVIHLLFIRKCV